MRLGVIDFSEKHANIGTLFWATVELWVGSVHSFFPFHHDSCGFKSCSWSAPPVGEVFGQPGFAGSHSLDNGRPSRSLEDKCSWWRRWSLSGPFRSSHPFSCCPHLQSIILAHQRCRMERTYWDHFKSISSEGKLHWSSSKGRCSRISGRLQHCHAQCKHLVGSSCKSWIYCQDWFCI